MKLGYLFGLTYKSVVLNVTNLILCAFCGVSALVFIIMLLKME